MGTCVFCGWEGKLSGEHVWPDWLRQHFPPAPSRVRHARGVADGSSNEWHAPPFKQKVNDVCRTVCNNGWMNNLENAAKPSLTAMLADEQITLSRAGTKTLAAWATKTAMMLSLTTSNATLFPAAHFRDLYESRTDPTSPAARIELFRYNQDRWAAYWQGHALTVAAEGAAHSPAYGATMAIGNVGFHIFGCQSRDFHLLPRDGSPMAVRHLRQIWPPEPVIVQTRRIVWNELPGIGSAELTALAESFLA